ncbi:MAG: protein-L-isoaspartate(D-aspartate) O-methyltransferase [Candidatus Omnitrophica bacterium]|nr:protein-L-isoaspartate(D-aspartate) O-methyltransferase [Candidatus Omnitrophota bacterium]
MVRDQIAARGVKDLVVLAAMIKVDRLLFVPDDMRDMAYADSPLPIGYGQTISQPYIVAYMTEQASLGKDERVLEIGTGSGYQTAILGEIVREVYSIEVNRSLAEQASRKLEVLGYENVKVKYGDGYGGWPGQAPFDAIIITAAPPVIPEELLDQLKEGGRMIVPAGTTHQEIYRVTKLVEGYKKEELIAVRFVPMVRYADKLSAKGERHEE